MNNYKNNRSKGSKNPDKTSNYQGKRKNSGKRNSYSPRSGGKYPEDEAFRKDKPDNSLNDISWYSKYPDLLVAAANTAFPYRPGMGIKISTSEYVNGSDRYSATTYTNIPGVMTLSWVPSIGRSQQITDPVNVAAKEIYARIRAAYSGHIEVDAPDLIMYLGALDSIFSYIGALKRIYRLLSSDNPNNYNFPELVLHALGINRSTAIQLKRDKQRLFSIINQLIYQTRKFNLPSIMDWFTRHYWMNDNIYSDAPDLASQMYVFRQDAFYRYSDSVTVVDANGNPDSSGTKATGLIYTIMGWSPSSGDPVDYYYNFGDQLISALASSMDGYTISGYLARAFEGVPTFVVEPLGMDEVAMASYTPEVLSQIENSFTCAISPIDGLTWFMPNIAQDVTNNAVISIPKLSRANTPYADNEATYINAIPYANALTIRSERPTPADVVIATRLKASLTWYGGDYVDIVAGTEIPLSWDLVTYIRDGNGVASIRNYAIQSAYGSQNFTVSDITSVLKATQFEYHPIILFENVTGTAPNVTHDLIPVMSLHNTTVLRPAELQEIHRVCILSEFNAFSI